MKWTTVLMILSIAATTGSLYTIDGGNNNLLFPSNPFYSPLTTCNINVYLTHPEDGATYLTNQLDINYSFSGNPSICSYQISGYLENTIPCNGSIRRTFSEGEQTLTVRVYKDTCIKSDSATFTVYSRTDYWGYIDYWFISWIFIGGVIMLICIIYGGKSRKKHNLDL